MNALIGKVQSIPVNHYIVWYSPEDFPSVSTNASLIDGDGDLLLINPGWGYKIIRVQQVNRIVTHHTAESHDLHLEECLQYEAEERQNAQA